jgi:PEP-CTERM motif
MTKLRKSILKLTILVLAALGAATSTKADPLVFSNVAALQNVGLTSVDLFSHPGATVLGPQITFRVDVTGMLPIGGTDTLRISYSELGNLPIVQSFQIPVFGNVQPPFTLLFTLISPGANSQGVAATLLVDLLNSSPDFVIPGGSNTGKPVDSYTYSFNVATSVPEPSSIMLAGMGITALMAKMRRRRRLD